MKLTTVEKIKVIAKRKGISVIEIAKELGCSRQNAHYKLRSGNLSEDDIKKYAAAIGCDYEVVLIDRETGERI